MIVSSSTDHSRSSHYWGQLQYQEADQLQSEAWAQVKSGSHGIILGGEVHHVVTLGLRARADHVLSNGLKPIQTKRGGEATLHSPGQLVIYPVVPLRENGMGVKAYIENLLRVSEVTFQDFQVPAQLRWEPLGLWTQKGKIGFCGVQVKSGITQHGLSLNISNNLELFSQIVSCGLLEAKYDKAINYNIELTPNIFFNRWVNNFHKLNSPVSIEIHS